MGKRLWRAIEKLEEACLVLDLVRLKDESLVVGIITRQVTHLQLSRMAQSHFGQANVIEQSKNYWGFRGISVVKLV